MGQPWGLSGPEFIGVYIAGLAAVICIPMVFRQVIRGAPSRPARDLDPYEVAYLAGGPSRVAQLVVTEQIGCGALRVDSSGRVTTANWAGRTGPYAAALDRISPAYMRLPDGLTSSRVCSLLSSDYSISALRDRLRDENLIISASRLTALRWVTVVPVLALLSTGVLRLILGVHSHRPVGILVFLLFASALVGASLIARAAAAGTMYQERLKFCLDVHHEAGLGQLLTQLLVFFLQAADLRVPRVCGRAAAGAVQAR